MKTYAFYDKKVRTPEEIQKFKDSFDLPNETKYPGIERLLVTEIPARSQPKKRPSWAITPKVQGCARR